MPCYFLSIPNGIKILIKNIFLDLISTINFLLEQTLLIIRNINNGTLLYEIIYLTQVEILKMQVTDIEKYTGAFVICWGTTSFFYKMVQV
ncbi:unnamed protein product [marine sediment metagenome]|uniref:Uncharacterized protein n=1 Tax=marine sediment metagenome TaxID=412755 RepID=X0TX96_9ZZZZ